MIHDGDQGDRSSGAGLDPADVRARRFSGQRPAASLTDSDPGGSRPRRKSGGGPANPSAGVRSLFNTGSRGSGTRRTSALNGLPVTMPPPVGDVPERRDTDVTGSRGGGPIAMSASGPAQEATTEDTSLPPMAPTAVGSRRRRSSGMTRNLRKTGRPQRVVHDDAVVLRPKREEEAVSKPLRRPSEKFSAVLRNRSQVFSTGRPSRPAAPPPPPERIASARQPAPEAPSKAPSVPTRLPSTRYSTSRHSSSRIAAGRPAPTHPVDWQILTKGGGVIPCDGINELINWKHSAMAVIGVSYRGQSWRDWEKFRAALKSGADGSDAWAATPMI